MKEEAKIRFLFRKIQHPELQSAVQAMKDRISTSANPISYTTFANHVSTAVSELSEYSAKHRSISGVHSEGDSPAIYKSDGSINTGFIPEWRSLSESDKKIVNDERSRLGLRKPGGRGRGRGGGRGGRGGGRGGWGNDNLKKIIKQQRRTIAALKKDPSDSPPDSDEKSNNKRDNDYSDAGDAFGGKAARKSKNLKTE